MLGVTMTAVTAGATIGEVIGPDNGGSQSPPVEDRRAANSE